MAAKDRDRPSWIRYSSLGIEFTAAVVGLTLVGLWVDGRYDSSPWGLLIGAGMGLVGGMYNLIRTSLAAFKDLEKPGRDPKKEHGPKP